MNQTRNFLLLIALILFSQCDNTATIKSAWISGEIKNATAEQLYLLNYPGDTLVKVSPDENGGFSFEVRRPAGYHQLKFGKEYGNTSLLFVRPGDSLSVSFDALNFGETIVYGGDGADRNNYLALDLKPEFNWYTNYYKNVSAAERNKKGSSELYFKTHYIDALKQRLMNETSDPEFQLTTSRNLDFEMARKILLDRYGFENDPEIDSQLIEELQKAMSIEIDDQKLLNSSKPYLSLVAYRLLAEQQLTTASIAQVFNAISSDKLQHFFLDEMLMALRKQLQYGEDDYSKAVALKAFLEDQDLNLGQEAVINLYEKFHAAEGQSPSFSYQNTDGKLVSLDEFKDNYIYIDFWATWCGPCLKEFPELHKVKEAYADKGIVFLGISIDKAERKDRWKKMIRDRSLSGIQLHAPMDGYIDRDDINDDFLELLYVNSWHIGIPQFALIDPDGKIMDAFTYRPSNAKLSQLFDQLLSASEE